MKKIVKLIVLSVALVSLYNIYVSVSLKSNVLEIILTDIEALADGESGINHGRPLLQSTSGAYKCANCSGSDCGAAC
ncbi:NVEALA domain-containing protein [uncultured Bacteroides sp.]|uniref:NVEALA domain-containing protein n=1 Tax=uncultured Bacteroides sp. TaxID=162156 RepID=UPI0025D7F889|nr:NVEALA domain-containing protein [uncultured Bacteroides sp.]